MMCLSTVGIYRHTLYRTPMARTTENYSQVFETGMGNIE